MGVSVGRFRRARKAYMKETIKNAEDAIARVVSEHGNALFARTGKDTVQHAASWNTSVNTPDRSVRPYPRPRVPNTYTILDRRVNLKFKLGDTLYTSNYAPVIVKLEVEGHSKKSGPPQAGWIAATNLETRLKLQSLKAIK